MKIMQVLVAKIYFFIDKVHLLIHSIKLSITGIMKHAFNYPSGQTCTSPSPVLVGLMLDSLVESKPVFFSAMKIK